MCLVFRAHVEKCDQITNPCIGDLGNEIQKVEGMEHLHDLRELVLDRNRIKNVSETSFINQWNLQELHVEENRLRDLANFNCLENLQRLYLGSNRIQVGILL